MSNPSTKSIATSGNFEIEPSATSVMAHLKISNLKITLLWKYSLTGHGSTGSC